MEKVGLSFLVGGIVGSSFTSSISNIKNSISGIDNKIKMLSQEKLDLKKQLNLDGAKVDVINKKLSNLHDKLLDLKTIKDIKINIQSNINELKDNFKSLTALTVGFAATIGTPVKAAMEFEHGLAGVTTLFGDTSVSMKGLQKQILGLSSNTGIAANEINNALYASLSNGLPVTKNMSEAMAFMEKNTMLAKAGFSDIATVTKASSSILNAYTLSVKETDRVHKILMQTQNLGSTTVKELGANLSKVTSVAASCGLSLEQVGASMATITHSGDGTAESATMLTSLIDELMKSETKADKNLKEALATTKYAGMSFKDLAEDGIPLAEILNLLGDYAKNSGKSLVDMFGSSEAGRAALKISGEHSEFYMKSLNAMSTSTDVVRESYDKMSNTLYDGLNRLKASFFALSITFGDVFLPQIKSISSMFTNLMKKISYLTEHYTSLTKVIAGGISFIFGAMIGFKVLSIAINMGSSAVSTFKLMLRILKPVLLGTTKLLKFVAVGFRTLAAAMILNPIGATITGIVTAIGLLYYNWDTVSDFMIKKWDKIKEGFISAKEFIVSFGSSVIDFYSSILSKIIDIVLTPFNMIKEQIINLKSYFGLSESDNLKDKFTIVKDVTNENRTIEKVVGAHNSVINNRSLNAPMTFSPNITINGNANKDDVIKAVDYSRQSFEKQMQEYQHNQARLSFSTGDL